MEKLEKNRIRMATRCINQNGDIVVDGKDIAIAAKHVEDTL
jgi:hypothetical protein